MKSYSYTTSGVCSRQILFDIEDGIIKTIDWYLETPEWLK